PHPTSTLFPYTTLFRSHKPQIYTNLKSPKVHHSCRHTTYNIPPQAQICFRYSIKSNQICSTSPSTIPLESDFEDFLRLNQMVSRSEEHTSELQSRENLV